MKTRILRFLSLAAVMSGKLKLPKGPAVAILSGGNADLKMILGA